MGGSGAGKTTLMDCIAGRKTVGHIQVGGVRGAALYVAFLRSTSR